MRKSLTAGALFLSLSLVPTFASGAIASSERDALLAFFNATGGPAWSDKSGWGGPAGTECSWKGVTCINDAVTELWLPDNNLVGTLPSSIAALTKLEVLYLTGNQLTGQIPPTVTSLTQLRTFSLSLNDLSGSIPAAIGNLTKLEHLELAENELTGSLPQSISSLTKLQSLTLYANQLSGEIPSSLGSLVELTYVALGDNAFTGTIPLTLGALTRLEELFLGGNQLEGTIPPSLGQLSALRTLQLDYNKLSGEIPAALSSLQKLEVLHLGFNELSGAIPAQIGNLASLKQLQLFLNELSGPIPASLGNLKNLEVLQLEHNELSGPVPDSLGSLSRLAYLALGYNSFSGSLPATLGDLILLEELTAEQNQLTGTIPTSFARLASLRKLEVSGNNINGPLPDLSTLSKLTTLSVSYNPIGGGLPLCVAQLPAIEGLYFDNTGISGPLPDAYAQLTTLKYLYVSGNALSGRIPEWIGNLSSMEVLLLAGNRFFGTLPASITRLSNLTYLHLADNRLRGELPPDIGNLQRLQYFEINGNAFSGRVPASFSSMKNLVYVVFANNEFIGELPSVEGFDQLALLNLSVNHFTGNFPIEMTRLPQLGTLSLGGNLYRGPLPNQIGDFPVLEFLGLWSNGFIGPIPPSIMKLVNIADGQLDLNHNGLFTNDAAVRQFVTAKQYDKEWETTQTIAPTQVTVKSITDRSAELTWQPIPYIYDQGGYRVIAATSPGGRPVAVVTTPEKESVSTIIRGLQPETTYFFTVASVTHPHDYQQNLIVSGQSAPVQARTTARVLAPAEVAVTRTPVGLIQIGGVPRNEDGFIVTNFGDVPTNITLHPGNENFFTVSPLTFTLAGGASQRVRITSIPQPAGSYWTGIGISGTGVPADLGVYFELLSVAAPTGTVVGEALASRIDLSGAADGSSVGTVTYANRGTSELRGVLISNVPWIVTTPGVVAIPPSEQRTVNFTVDRTKRTRDNARGSATGLLSLVYIDGGASLTSLKEIHSMDGLPAGVSISIVTVVDTAKPATQNGTIPSLSPQEIARFIPGVRSLNIDGRSFVSDLNIANSAGVATEDDVRLYFTVPNATSATIAPLGTVSAEESISLSNVVASVYGGAPNASLQLRSASWDKLTLSAALSSVSPLGNAGSSLPIFRSDRSADSGEKLFLVGVGKGSTLRGDVIVQETTGGATTARVDFHDASGATVGSALQLSVAPFGMAEALDAVPAGAVTAVVTNEGTSGDLAAYVQMLDTASGDTWSVVDWSRYFDYAAGDAVRVPFANKVSATSDGKRRRPVRPGSTTLAATSTVSTTTDLYVFNSGAAEGVADIRFVDRNGSTSDAQVTLAAGATLVLDDVLGRSFGKTGTLDGVLLVNGIQGSLIFNSRSRAGEVGTSVPVVPHSAGLRLGELQIFAGVADAKESTVAASEAGTFRTTLRLQETSGATTKVRVSLLFADGRAVVAANVSRDFELAPNQVISMDRISREIIGTTRDADYDDLFGMQLKVRVIEGEGSVLPLVIVTENASSDTQVRIE